MHFRKRSVPIAVNMAYRCGPFQCVRHPWVLHGFLTIEDAVEEVEEEEQLSNRSNDCKGRYEWLQVHHAA